MSIKFKAGDIILRSYEKQNSWWSTVCALNGKVGTGAFTVSHQNAQALGFICLDGLIKQPANLTRIPEFNPECFQLITKAPDDVKASIPENLRLQHSPDCAWVRNNGNFKCDCSRLTDGPKGSTGSSVTYTGGSSDYYQVTVKSTTTPNRPEYIAECNDIIEALGMNFAEGNAFKALWRRAAQRTLGLRKAGAKDDGLYDAEKVEFFGKRLVAMSKGNE